MLKKGGREREMKDRQSERWSVSLMEACILPMPPCYKSVKFTLVKMLVLLLKYQTAQNISKDLCQPCSLKNKVKILDSSLNHTLGEWVTEQTPAIYGSQGSIFGKWVLCIRFLQMQCIVLTNVYFSSFGRLCHRTKLCFFFLIKYF